MIKIKYQIITDNFDDHFYISNEIRDGVFHKDGIAIMLDDSAGKAVSGSMTNRLLSEDKIRYLKHIALTCNLDTFYKYIDVLKENNIVYTTIIHELGNI